MFKSAYEKIKRIFMIAIFTILIVAPIWGMYNIGMIQVTNTSQVFILSFSKQMLFRLPIDD